MQENGFAVYVAVVNELALKNEAGELNIWRLLTQWTWLD